MKVVRIAAAAMAFFGAGVGLAGQASADLTGSTYEVTSTNRDGSYSTTSTWIFAPCGAGCFTRTVPSTGNVIELRQSGDTWTGVQGDGGPGSCVTTISGASLTGSIDCSGMYYANISLRQTG